MDEHEEGEMHRQPLDSVILGLRAMLGTRVIPVLENVIEPPHIENIDRAFAALNEDGLINAPNDEGVFLKRDLVFMHALHMHICMLFGVYSMYKSCPSVFTSHKSNGSIP
jgi:HrpA-like RNA helicase